MGCGKTATGRCLAQDVGFEFLDTDCYIEQNSGQSVADIFTQHGEAHFRKLEAELLFKLQNTKNTVIASGGGMVASTNRMQLAQNLGGTVYLQTSPAVLLWRLSNSQQLRPLLPQPLTENWIKNLLQQREIFYKQANYTLIIDNLSVKGVTQNIKHRIEKNEII